MAKFINIHVHEAVNEFQIHFVKNFIQNSLVVLVYHTAFDHILNGKFTIVLYVSLW